MKIVVLYFSLLFSNCLYSQQTVSFFKKANPGRTYERRLPVAVSIRKYSGEKINGCISAIRDSFIVLKTFHYRGKDMNRYKEIRKIQNDKLLFEQEKFIKIIDLEYPDSVQIPFASVKSILFSNSIYSITVPNKGSATLLSALSLIGPIFDLSLRGTSYNHQGVFIAACLMSGTLLIGVAVEELSYRTIRHRKWDLTVKSKKLTF